MKKEFIFAPIMLAIAILLFLLRTTGMTLHIIISIAGIAVLVAYTVTTKREWKIKPAELAMRACYGLALISGIIIKAAKGIRFLVFVHKFMAILFVVMLIALFVHKLIVNKSSK
jgi:predicted ABC-type sugar transport system permease subunit